MSFFRRDYHVCHTVNPPLAVWAKNGETVALFRCDASTCSDFFTNVYDGEFKLADFHTDPNASLDTGEKKS